MMSRRRRICQMARRENPVAATAMIDTVHVRGKTHHPIVSPHVSQCSPFHPSTQSHMPSDMCNERQKERVGGECVVCEREGGGDQYGCV
jgi:hypothetical protein